MGVFFWIVNILGALAGLPLLFLSTFLFDSPHHVALAFFLFATNMAYPLMSVIAMFGDKIRYLGVIGLAITCLSFLIVTS